MSVLEKTSTVTTVVHYSFYTTRILVSNISRECSIITSSNLTDIWTIITGIPDNGSSCIGGDILSMGNSFARKSTRSIGNARTVYQTSSDALS